MGISIKRIGEKYLTVSGDVATITWVGPQFGKKKGVVGYFNYGEINGKRYDFTTDGKCFSVMGRSNRHLFLERQVFVDTDPEYFL